MSRKEVSTHTVVLRMSLVAASLLALLLGGVLLVGRPAAHAQALTTPLLNCLGTDIDHYKPGITNTRQPINVKADQTLGPCVVPTQLNLTGGTTHYEATFSESCTELGFGGIQVSYHWNNGMQSLVNFGNATFEILANGEILIVEPGVVQSGFGAGDIAVETITLPQFDPTACSSPQGVTSVAGPLTLTFTAA